MTSPLTLLAAGLLTALAWTASAQPTIKSVPSTMEVAMGDSIILTTTVRTGVQGTQAGNRVIPFMNGKRWGAIETTDASGVAVHHLPFPTPGSAEIQVMVEPPAVRGPRAHWIWGNTAVQDATYYFQRVFSFDGDPAEAMLWVAVDDTATIHINGTELGRAEGWGAASVYSDLSEVLVPGENVLSIEAHSPAGLAGLLVRLAGGATMDTVYVVSDSDWTVYSLAPYGWPYRSEEDGVDVAVLSGVEWSPWRRGMRDWPTLERRDLDLAGVLLPEGVTTSKPVNVKVTRRPLERPRSLPGQRVGIQFEPWFTPQNASWGSSHAIPLTGLYWSWNGDVLRQQVIWLIESGIDFLVVDWTNHLWDKAHWDERADGTNEIIHATTQLLETLAQFRDEGETPPTVVLYVGLNNGPSTTVEAVNEVLAWIYHTYVRNPRFAGLFETYLDKPLVLAHNGGGPAWVDAAGASRLDDRQFTIRYQSYHHELNDHAAHGFWSWMDATLAPVVTQFEGAPEALTVSTAFFAGGGWKQDGAYGRNGGWTFVEGFKQALSSRPRFLQIHQYQEFAGQWEGYGYGPAKDIYVDSYSVELSDDIEPVSLTAHAYRGEGGWGFYYLNLLRALVDCYGQEVPETTVVALAHPGYGRRVTGTALPLRWTWTGAPPVAFRLDINGRFQEFPPEVLETALDLTPYDAGPLTITLTALGTQSRYPLSYTEASHPLAVPEEASAHTQLVYAPE